jgi:ethanolamine utilization cobalamin adenosyltransferase
LFSYDSKITVRLNRNHLKSERMITPSTKGFWNEKKVKLKEKYPDIKDEDLQFNEGKEKVMLEMLGYKLGKTEQELLGIIVDL